MMDEDKIIEAIARTLSVVATNNPNLHKPGEQLPQAAWEDQPLGWRDRCTKEARAVWIATKAALAEAGTTIVPQQEPRQKETFAEEIARLQREIGQRQWRLQYLVCGDPRVRVTVPVAPAPDQR